ncbi:2OG-Fe(II) oxygenase [Erythrobacter oryzae]|uniref:2OG-Fe(II) oxygenase n=1 Tax=Erythrobacter oryzae TaxID=3019556 RepID=UPI00255226E0|nr:2OG-Fe(II) oxygenase [Erythrobacter sp. COR-2]
MLLPAVIIDDFLGADAAGDLLAFALAHEADFVPSEVGSEGDQVVKPETRNSLSFEGDLGEVIAPFAAAVAREAAKLKAATGCGDFGPDLTDLELVAHCDGHRFRRHVDTATGASRMLGPADRVLSLVYYLHAKPKVFSGGDLVMHALVGEERRVIAPRHDRLVAFPSIAPHQVAPISLPGNRFADARFSLVCWLGRERAGAPAA